MRQIEFFEDTHTYLVDGILVPSVTELIHRKYPNKYKFVSSEVLQKASERGIGVHKAIEEYITEGKESDLQELRNYKFLEKMYHFKGVKSEIPIYIELDGIPVCAGRLDMVIESDGKIGGGDIKCQTAIDKEMVAYQLNLYRIGYRQCYGTEWEFLKCIQLKGDTRKYHNLPICEDLAWELLKETI